LLKKSYGFHSTETICTAPDGWLATAHKWIPAGHLAAKNLALASPNWLPLSARIVARALAQRQLSLNQTNLKKPIMTLNVRPLGDRILVEPIEEKDNKSKKGGIIIPDIAKEKPTESLVVAVGTGKTDDNGRKVPFEVKKGDRVLVSKYGGTEIKLDGKEYKILNGDDILAVIE
jgi:chaperonin GroES